MRRRLVLVVGCLFTLAIAAGPAAAQRPKQDAQGALAAALTGDARKAYDEARVLYTQGEFARALDALERAYRLAADPRLLWNMAACERKLGRYASAMRRVERYRSAAATMLSDNEKREADEFLSAAAMNVGTVTVTSNVEGTAITVDDQLLGTTPLPKPIVVDEGDHRVRFARGGYRTVERRERVLAGGQLRWVVELERESSGPAATQGAAQVAPPAAAQQNLAGPSRLGPLLLAGGGVVAAGIGTFLVIGAHDDAKTIEADCGTRCPPSRWEAGQTQERIGDVLLGIGAAAIVTGVVWWILQPSARDRAIAGASW
jgi:hypothetical protein